MIGKSLDQYQIVDKLGEGAMGVVYKARDTRLDRFVAIKILPPQRFTDPDRKRRFVQEAKAASALNHPNIITIHDIGEVGGIAYIAMEYVRGKTLDELITRNGLRISPALKYAVQIADALACAHGSGIIHRDLKPSNIAVDEQGLVKILDFGLAKLVETTPAGDGTSTQTAQGGTDPGAIAGTIAYMSPEQAEGQPLDARSDIFSFGSVLYEMLTGQHPFRAGSAASTMASILREEPKPMGEIRTDLPGDLDKLVRRCLRKDRTRRWQTMADIRVALADIKEESDSGVTRPLQARRHQWLWPSITFAALALAAGLLWFSWLRHTPELSPTRLVPLSTYPGAETSPTFSPDGTQVAFMWDGGTGGASHMTNGGGRVAFESADGKDVFYAKEFGLTSVWKVSVQGGTESPVMPGVDWQRFAVAADGIYCSGGPDPEDDSFIQFRSFAKGANDSVGKIQGRLSFGLSVLPDRRWALVTKLADRGSDLMLVENFR